MDEAAPTCEFDENELILRLTMAIAADLEGLESVIEKVMSLVGEMGCAQGKEFEIETALREALVNAIVHGAGRDPAKKVEFCVACDPARGMLIIVRDPGEGFDPRSIPSPIIGQNIFSSHGRGIFLITQLMDEVRFERGGTEIHMRKF